jgi:hypothetical protein
MITIYDANGTPHLVTIQEYIQLEAVELAALVEMSSHDPL